MAAWNLLKGIVSTGYRRYHPLQVALLGRGTKIHHESGDGSTYLHPSGSFLLYGIRNFSQTHPAENEMHLCPVHKVRKCHSEVRISQQYRRVRGAMQAMPCLVRINGENLQVGENLLRTHIDYESMTGLAVTPSRR